MSFIASFIYVLLVLNAWVAALLTRNWRLSNKQSIAAAREKEDNERRLKGTCAKVLDEIRNHRYKFISTPDALFKLAQCRDDGLYVHREVRCRAYPY